MTDLKLLFDVITRKRYTTEARLMMEIAAVREAYNQRLIPNIAFIKTEHNVADALAKTKSNDAPLWMLQTHMLNHLVEQFVVDKHIALTAPFDDEYA